MDMEFGWEKQEVILFRDLWNQGMDVYQMADVLKRDPDEIAILVIDQARKGNIDKRSGGARGYTCIVNQ